MGGTQQQNLIDELLRFLTLHSRLEGNPGFTSVLGLTPERLSKGQFYYNDDSGSTGDEFSATLTFRYTLPSRLAMTRNNEETITLSTYLSLLDEITTWAILLASKRRNSLSSRLRFLPGVGISFQASWGPGALLGLFPGAVVDVTSTVTKVGKNLACVRAEVLDKDSGALICFATHSKFMQPPSLKKNFLWNSMLGRWGLKMYSKYAIPEPDCTVNYDIDELFDSLDFVSHTQAHFNSSKKHVNSMGVLHGGCQAFLMELVGSQVAMHAMASGRAYLDSIQISYHSEASSELQIDAFVLRVQQSSVTLRIVISRRAQLSNHRQPETVVSEGILTFVDSLEPKASPKEKESKRNLNVIRAYHSSPPIFSDSLTMIHQSSFRSLCYRNKTGASNGSSSGGSVGVATASMSSRLIDA